MALARGTKLGPYQIESPIGAGGMGEVYKATDTRLERTVAIKVLPAHVASDPERRSRFEREAKTVAALSHPHICPVFDVGSEDGTDFLVMEYLEGETLAERLSKGALPLDQALRYAIEIADALDKAHRQGVTHRDLKPANIMLTKAGAKLLDFGLAKLKPTGPQSDASTKLADNLTEQGTILGTFQYMAPEQLEGGEADHRTDIFAYGAVVYEMVTGQRAFSGESRASLIAAILDRAPSPLATLQPLAPAALDHVVRMSLAKTPDDRWQSAGDIAREVKWISESGSQPSAAAVSGEGTNSRLSVGMAVSIALGLSVLTGLAVWGLTRSLQTERRADRFAINVPPGALLNATYGRHIAISPDGGSVVYVAGTIGNTDLYVRAFDELAPTTLTEGQTEIGIPSVSEDGAWVAFNTPRDDSLKKVATLGGPVSAICVGCAQIALGVSWATDDTLVFGSNLPSGLWRVSAEGGDVEELTTPESPQINHAWPEVLPGGRAALFTSLVGEFVETAQIALVDLETGEHEVLIPGGSFPRYSPTGHIVYGDAGTLWAIGFDADRLEVTGARPVPVLDGVLTGRSGINFDFSRNGTLVYVQGPDMTQAIERTPVLARIVPIQKLIEEVAVSCSGIVTLRSRVAEMLHDQPRTQLPRLSISTRHHRSRRLALLSLQPQFSGC